MGKILFCGSYIPDNIVGKLQYSSQAGNCFQEKIITELKKYHDIEILSYIGFPISKEYIQALSSELKKKNIIYIIRDEWFTRAHSFIEYCKKLKEMLVGKEIVILYNYYYFNFFLFHLAKKMDVKTVLIVADHGETSDYKNPFRKLLAIKNANDYNKFDGLIFLSSSLRERYPKSTNIVVEGGISFIEFNKFKAKSRCDTLKILYSGLLNNVTGIDILLQAIESIPTADIEFWFTGRGILSSQIIELQKKDERIKFFGFVSKEEYFKILNDTNVVINPRNMLLPQNKNNFPSKILEYLASGRVIISTRFPGYDKFKQNMIFSEPTAEGIAEAINFCNAKYEGIYKTQFDINRKYALEYDWAVQGKKINEFLSKIFPK